jgi:hypothetical protein
MEPALVESAPSPAPAIADETAPAPAPVTNGTPIVDAPPRSEIAPVDDEIPVSLDHVAAEQPPEIAEVFGQEPTRPNGPLLWMTLPHMGWDVITRQRLVIVTTRTVGACFPE